MITLTREEAQQVLCAIQENWRTHEGDKAIETLRARLSEKEQEPVAWLTDREEMHFDKEDAKRYSNGFVQPLYTAPPQREWQGLTDDEVEEQYWAWEDMTEYPIPFFEYRAIARAIEAKLKEKNG